MAKHIISSHPDIDRSQNGDLFKAKIEERCDLNLQRYITEATEIEWRVNSGEQLLNSKGEWGRVSLKRLTVDNT